MFKRHQFGKCTNYAGCKLAYRNEKIIVNTDDFKCPECGSPLETIHPVLRSYGLEAIIGSIIVFIILAFGVMIWTRWYYMDDNQPPPIPIPTPTPNPTATPTPPPLPKPSPTLPPIPVPTPPPSPTPSPTPVPVSSDHLDTSASDLAKIKLEVAKRIDLMPDLSSSKKEALFSALAKAKGLKLLATVSFKTGLEKCSETDSSLIKAALASPEISKLLDDPSVVFVILGYASKTGTAQLNMNLSQLRANSLMNQLQLDFQVRNAAYAVPMGESTLFGKSNNLANQVAELWIVLP
jgi:hypothetical protein